MWIALGIIGFIAALITVILLLPVKIIIRNDEQNELILRYKFLWKTFGENPNPDDPIVKALLDASGVSRLKKNKFQKNVKTEGLQKAVSDSYDMLIDLLKEVLGILKYLTITRLQIKIRATGDGPDEAAIHYGQCCAATYSLLNILRGLVKVKKRGCDIDVGCDLFGSEPVFRYEAVLVIRVNRVLAAFWRTVMAEAKRMRSGQQTQQK